MPKISSFQSLAIIVARPRISHIDFLPVAEGTDARAAPARRYRLITTFH
jgi:hypothetical protein